MENTYENGYGNIVRKEMANGQYVEYFYDLLDRPTKPAQGGIKMHGKRIVPLVILLLITCILIAWIGKRQDTDEDIGIIDGISCGMSPRAVASLLGTPTSEEANRLTGGIIAKYHYPLGDGDTTGDATCRFIKSGLGYKLHAVSVHFTLSKDDSPSAFLEELTNSLISQYQDHDGYSIQENDGYVVIIISDGARITHWELQLSDGKVIAQWEAVF